MQSVEVRASLVQALKLDLIGPEPSLGLPEEELSQPPSRWYLTGFIVPRDAGEEQKADEESNEELAAEPSKPGVEDGSQPDNAAAKKKFLPSSIGISVLVPKDVTSLNVAARWGDYTRIEGKDNPHNRVIWRRAHREATETISIPHTRQSVQKIPVSGSGGLEISWSVRPVNVTGNLKYLLPQGVRVVSVFLVNEREARDAKHKDEAFAFQAHLTVKSTPGKFVPRPDLRSFESDDNDERIADLQYREDFEFAVGHAVSTEAIVKEGHCAEVRTCWVPQAEVEKVAPATTRFKDVELSMDALAQLKDGDDAAAKLGSLVTAYREWIKEQQNEVLTEPDRRKDMAKYLYDQAEVAAKRIKAGIDLLANPQCLEAFKLANKAMAQQARQRRGVWEKKDPAAVKPSWFPFQLTFVLMNLRGIHDPTSDDRGVVDLLFFPTGGGKTEAYLGLAAFTLVLRRLKNPNVSAAGLSVLMRYTLRLLTLDQLSRAATLICALEQERKTRKDLGEWPFEIGLWVGQAATPNKMGCKGDNNPHSARTKTNRFRNNSQRHPPPIPLRECPWCGQAFTPECFDLRPDKDNPIDLLVRCASRDCAFNRTYLPIVAVDEPVYRRLPCFMIATVDKFAAMPWTGGVAGFFGHVQRHDQNGFYGACSAPTGAKLPDGRLPPPDLIIQDELHLISGPLGTMVGLYESALDELASIEIDNMKVRPKIIASTATVRRAQAQIQALFNRRTVDIFPPPGADRRDSFFAETHASTKSHARLYVGVAAQGRSPKLIMLKVYLAVLSAAQKAYAAHPADTNNPADAYMTLLGYFNSLRELGGSRRVIEDEVNAQIQKYDTRKRLNEIEGVFARRKIAYEPLELTSRVKTSDVAHYKGQLAKNFCEDGHADIAIATNMISVGLDIVRLGLMVVFGQPKSSAEYIQATSRVGRDSNRPGLVVSLLNIHKPRDRSHYERFAAFHQTFYRSVEATSVTPFSPRALDRGLAGTLVALARLGHNPMTPSTNASKILTERSSLDFVVAALAARAESHRKDSDPEENERFRQSAKKAAERLLNTWLTIAKDVDEDGGALKYQKGESGNGISLLHDFLDATLMQLHPHFLRFRANRSMRDVEPEVNLWMKTFDNVTVLADEEDEDDE